MADGSTRVDDPDSTPTRPGGTGGGATRMGATGTGVDGIVAGGALVLTLYGLLVIAADLVADKKLTPHSGIGVAALIVGCLVVGAVLGGIAASRSDR